jgi:alpha-L-rhamnosidase
MFNMSKRVMLVAVLGLLAGSLALSATIPPEADAKPGGVSRARDSEVGKVLQGSMIWSPSVPSGTQAYVAFRKTFELPDPTTAAVLHVFADSRYMLWVNGTYVLRGPCRFNPKRPEFDSVNLRPFLKRGSNALVVLVHHYAEAVNGRIMRHAPGLTASLEVGGKEILRTDNSWRCSDKTQYRPSPGAWSSIPDVLDGRLCPLDWTASTFDDAAWQPAVPVDGRTWGGLQPRSIPLARETELTGMKLLPSGQALEDALPLALGNADAAKAALGPDDKSSASATHGVAPPAEISVMTNGEEAAAVVVDLGRMAMAYAVVELEADEGSVLQMQYALRHVNGQPAETYGVGTSYTARAGRQHFIAADQWCSRYVMLKCAAGRIRILGLKMMDRRYPFERLGSFACSDATLTRLWDMAVNTIEVTSDDAYGSDARERDEWLQDPAQPNFITTRVALAGPGADGNKVFSDPRLLKNLLRHAALAQLPDGRIPATFPTDRGPEDCHYVIEDYSCQWVESLKLYFNSTGDREFVREMWPTLTRQMQWFLDRRTPRGLLLAREYASFDNPLAYITCEGATVNAYFYQALADSEYLGRALGQNPQAAAYANAAKELGAAYNRQFWNEAAAAYNSAFLGGQPLAPTAHAQLLALDRGLVPENRVAVTRKWLLANYKNPGGFHCGGNPDYAQMIAQNAGLNMPVSYYWMFQELYRMDTAAMDQEALGEMRRRWTPMVGHRQDAGTLCESFVDAGGGGGGGGSEACHNYGAVPAYFLSSHVLGVRLNGPVWDKRLLIEPRLGDLTDAEGVVVTEFGTVSVLWQRVGNELLFRLTTPAGITSVLRLPDANAATLMLDGKHTAAEVQGRCAVASIGGGKHEGQVGLLPGAGG